MQFIMLYFLAVIVCDEHYAAMFVHITISIQFKRAVDTLQHKAVDTGAGVPYTCRYSNVQCEWLLVSH